MEDLLNHPNFSITRRPKPMTDELREFLISQINDDIKLEGYGARQIKTRNAYQIYSEVLHALGREISSEDIAKMLRAQEKFSDDKMESEFRRRLEDESLIAGVIL